MGAHWVFIVRALVSASIVSTLHPLLLTDREMSRITEELIGRLQRARVSSTFRGIVATVDANTIEPDGRRRPAVVKELVESGFVQSAEQLGRYEPTAKVLEEMVVQTVRLEDRWEHLLREHEREPYSRPWIPVSKLSTAEQLGVLRDTSCDWFVVATDPYRYMQQFSDTADTVNETDRYYSKYTRYWSGPLSKIEEAHLKLGETHNTQVAVSSKSLRLFVRSYLRTKKLNQEFAKNLPWALAKLKLLAEHELFGEDNQPIIDRQLNEGFVIRGCCEEPETAAEVEWEANLQQSVTRLRQGIDRRKRTIELLERIEDAVAEHGGWEVFKQDFWKALEAELAEEDNDG